MIRRRAAEERGHASHGWLDSYHTFSFGGYHDAAHMGFRALRVLNDDTVQPGRGFGTHGHENMEIISYVLDGALAHRDSTGAGAVLHRGDVQWMSAGRGVTHSEFNASGERELRFLQIWILPAETDGEPAHDDRRFGPEEKLNRLRLIASPDGSEGSLPIGQDVRLYASLLDHGALVRHEPAPGRHAWVQVARGEVRLNDLSLTRGDGAAVSDEAEIRLEGASPDEPAEILLFDLA